MHFYRCLFNHYDHFWGAERFFVAIQKSATRTIRQRVSVKSGSRNMPMDKQWTGFRVLGDVVEWEVWSATVLPCNIQDIKDLLLTSWCLILQDTFRGLVESFWQPPRVVLASRRLPTANQAGVVIMFWLILSVNCGCKYTHTHTPGSYLFTLRQLREKNSSSENWTLASQRPTTGTSWCWFMLANLCILIGQHEV